MRNANVIECRGCRQEASAAFSVCSPFLQLDTGAGLTKNGGVAQTNATGIGVLEKGGRTAATRFFYVRRMATRVLGGCVGSPSGLAGSFPGTPTRTVALPIGVGRAVLESLERINAMSTTKTPAKGKSPATPKTPAEPPATPAMIEGVFAVLHHEGWRPSQRSAFSVAAHTPVLDGKVKLPTRAQMDAARTYAEQMGWTPLSPQLADLMRIILRMNYRGRNLVTAVAKAMQREHPWLDDDPRNTNTLE